MKTPSFFALLWMLILLSVGAPDAFAQGEVPSTIAYQGYLTNTDGDPANGTAPVIFRLYDDDLDGAQVWIETQPGVVFTDGVFTVHLGAVESLDGVPFARPLWLSVAVAGSQELTPRVALDAVPYALSVRGLRTLPGEDPNFTEVPNVVLGFEGNYVEEGISAAVISGGGGTGFDANQVSASYGTIGGGNTNNVTEFGGTVSGGASNQAQGSFSTVGGGSSNRTQDSFSTIGGGISNRAEGIGSTIGGGGSNTAEGEGATVPGGISNQADGDYSFAAGVNARADHDGVFVWNGVVDNNDPPFSSTGGQQFLIRAPGGVGIGTNAPEEGALHVTNTESNRDLVLGGTDDSLSGDDGVISSDPAFDSSDLLLISNDAVAVFLDADESGETAEFIVADANFNAAFQVDLSGTVTTGQVELENELGTDDTPAAGGVYRDNVVYAWAHVLPNGTVTASYGCTVSKLLGTGSYRVSFKRPLPNGASAVVTVQTLNDPVIATAVTNANQADVATKVFNGAAFVAADYGFYVQVVGRP